MIVQCHSCPSLVIGDPSLTVTQLRARLRKQGWRTAVPYWATLSPRIDKRQLWAEHPELRGKTVDRCPACVRRSVEAAFAKLREWREWDERQALLDLPCSPTVQ